MNEDIAQMISNIWLNPTEDSELIENLVIFLPIHIKSFTDSFKARFFKKQMARRIYFQVTGSVQGVGFRYFTRKHATAYGLTGWVRNTTEGKVEGEAQGEDEKITKLLSDLNKGPRGGSLPSANVEKVHHEDRDVVQGESDFEVRH